MSDELCDHQWGEAELCETRLGNIMSPTCRHCGAVKIVEQQRAVRDFTRRAIENVGEPRPSAPPYITAGVPLIPTNIPPAAAPAVHPFQSEFFSTT